MATFVGTEYDVVCYDTCPGWWWWPGEPPAVMLADFPEPGMSVQRPAGYLWQRTTVAVQRSPHRRWTFDGADLLQTPTYDTVIFEWDGEEVDRWGRPILRQQRGG